MGSTDKLDGADDLEMELAKSENEIPTLAANLVFEAAF